jgi:uncharacterized YigZ family protein
MALRYRTVATAAQTELVVRRSRFISYLEPVDTEEQVAEQLARIRKLHPSATHHCYAYQICEPQQLARSSDDGEPAGTAGRPILEAMQHHQIQHALVVVVRYFGGVMLGAGGLIRAYGEAAHAGLLASGIIERRTHLPLSITVDYPTYGKLEYALRQQGIRFGSVEFRDVVQFTCWPEVEMADQLGELLIEWTQNRLIIERLDQIILDHPVK